MPEESGYFEHLFEFVKIFWRTYVALVTGGILALFLTGWAFFGKGSPPAWIFWLSLSIFFFATAFETWRRERIRARQAENELIGGPLELERRNQLRMQIRALSQGARDLLRAILVGGGGDDVQRDVNQIRRNNPVAELLNQNLIMRNGNRLEIAQGYLEDMRAIFNQDGGELWGDDLGFPTNGGRGRKAG